MFIYLTGVVILLIVLEILLNYNEKARMVRKIPGPKGTFILGNILDLNVPPTQLMTVFRDFAAKFNGIYRLWSYPFAIVNIYNPEDIEKILSSSQHIEKSIIYKFIEPWLQEGLLVSKGTKWLQRRKILTPTLHFNMLRHFYEIFEQNSQRLVTTLHSKKGELIEIVPLLNELALSIINETAMGTKLDETKLTGAKYYKEALYKIGNLFFYRFSRFYLYSDVIFYLTTAGKSFKECLSILHNFTKKVIQDRKSYIEEHGISLNHSNESLEDDCYMFNKKKKVAMLDLLISAEKEGLIDAVGIQAEVDTFTFAGHDTTASGLTFCLVVLANHQHIQDKIYDELQTVFGDSKRRPVMEDFSKMHYLECCIKESMRLFPPVPLISRRLNESIELSNYKIPTGTICHIHIFDLHRRKDLYEDPLVYNPDRFLRDNSVGRHPYAFIPFSAGPRNCIGQKFAMLEMKVAIASILREFKLLPGTRMSDIKLQADMTLKNEGPMRVAFVKRDSGMVIE